LLRTAFGQLIIFAYGVGASGVYVAGIRAVPEPASLVLAIVGMSAII
jgi:hypothetical protein